MSTFALSGCKMPSWESIRSVWTFYWLILSLDILLIHFLCTLKKKNNNNIRRWWKSGVVVSNVASHFQGWYIVSSGTYLQHVRFLKHSPIPHTLTRMLSSHQVFHFPRSFLSQEHQPMQLGMDSRVLCFYFLPRYVSAIFSDPSPSCGHVYRFSLGSPCLAEFWLQVWILKMFLRNTKIN